MCLLRQGKATEVVPGKLRRVLLCPVGCSLSDLDELSLLVDGLVLHDIVPHRRLPVIDADGADVLTVPDGFSIDIGRRGIAVESVVYPDGCVGRERSIVVSRKVNPRGIDIIV